MAQKKHQTIAETLRQEIKRRKLTAYRVAKDGGIPVASVATFMEGNMDTRISNVQKIADYLGYELVKRRGK